MLHSHMLFFHCDAHHGVFHETLVPSQKGEQKWSCILKLNIIVQLRHLFTFFGYSDYYDLSLVVGCCVEI